MQGWQYGKGLIYWRQFFFISHFKWRLVLASLHEDPARRNKSVLFTRWEAIYIEGFTKINCGRSTRTGGVRGPSVSNARPRPWTLAFTETGHVDRSDWSRRTPGSRDEPHPLPAYFRLVGGGDGRLGVFSLGPSSIGDALDVTLVVLHVHHGPAIVARLIAVDVAEKGLEAMEGSSTVPKTPQLGTHVVEGQRVDRLTGWRTGGVQFEASSAKKWRWQWGHSSVAVSLCRWVAKSEQSVWWQQ